jgi:parallel beta-helix repeat protein
MFDSSPYLFLNEIHENQRSGIIVSGSSFPKIEKNNIYGNTTSGVIIRDTSLVLMEDNEVNIRNLFSISIL